MKPYQDKDSGPKASALPGDLNSASPVWRNTDSWAQLLTPDLQPIRILFLMGLSIFIGEMCVMFLLQVWPDLPVFPEALVDASVLVLMLSPTLYFFHYRPMVQNFQQRNLIMEQLVASEERLHLALQAVNDGLWDWDIETNDVYFSPQCSIMLGYHPDDLKPDFDSLIHLIHPEDQERFQTLVHEHLSGNLNEIRIELRLKCRSESHEWLWVLIRGKIVDRAEDGAPLRAVGTNTNIHERKQAEQALLQSEDGVRFLSRQLIQASEEEKKYLALELHDDFGQMITAFKMGVEIIRGQQCDDHPELEYHCARLLEIGDRMGSSLREICDDLRPAMLDDLGLTRTLEWLVDRFSEQHLQIKTRIDQPELNMRLPAEIELICYRVCQEALNNISKHANPTTVDIALTAGDDTVELEIKDNGCGFDPSQRKSKGHWGIGLLGIHERATALGGSAEIKSSIGNGTVISVVLPRHPKE